MALEQDPTISSWLFSSGEIKNTPSVQDGITSVQEMKLRKSACRFIADIGQNLIYPASIVAINSAKIFLHRFYMKHSLKHFPDHKSEECLRALKDFIWAWNKIEEGHSFGRYHGEDKMRKPWQIDEGTKEFQEVRDNILQFERDLLHVLGFDFQINHAQAYILRLIQFFDGAKRDKETRTLVLSKSPEGEVVYSELGKLVITAASAMVNDMTLTTLGVQYEATALGAACTTLALRTQCFKIVSTEKWVKKLIEEWGKDTDSRFNSVKITKQQVDDICEQLLDLYDEIQSQNTKSGSSSAPAPASAPTVAQGPVQPVVSQVPAASAPAKATSAPPADGPAKAATDKREKLEAGEPVLMPGSGPKPYELLRKGNVYSCSCSIWRNIDDIEQRRTCKHLRQLRGEKAETGRVGEEGIRKSDEKLKELLEADRRAHMARQQAAQAQAQAQGHHANHPHSALPHPPQQPPPSNQQILGKRLPEGQLQPDCTAAIKRQHVA